MTGKQIALLSANGGIMGAVLGGAFGFLRSGGRKDAKDIAMGAGVGAVLGAGTLLLQSAVSEAISSAGSSAPAAGLPKLGAAGTPAASSMMGGGMPSARLAA